MRLQKLLICLLFPASIFTAFNSIAQQGANLSVNDFEKGIKSLNTQVLDVRTYGEYQTGHLKNALLADWMNQEEFTKKVQSIDKSKPVYTYCHSGGRSGEATKWLIKKGYTVFNLNGGIAAWKKEGKAIEEAVKSN